MSKGKGNEGAPMLKVSLERIVLSRASSCRLSAYFTSHPSGSLSLVQVIGQEGPSRPLGRLHPVHSKIT